MTRRRIVELTVAGLIALVSWSSPAPAYDWNYCKIYAREYVRVVVASDPDFATATDVLVEKLLNGVYAKCVNTEFAPALPDVPEASDGSWVRWMATVVRKTTPEQGTVPATADPTPETTTDSAWATACKKRWPASFDAATGTVIRRGSHNRRTKCPL